ncbi:MAG: hypothetical protein DMD94_13625 [Candidatus Rokuibacteriota bacterium]|nr:MAG: hypothetical protein DMD94_13625 [Candidatus Rokubacteria bacterium]
MVRVPVARILVTDDDPELVDILVTHLCEEGYGGSGALTRDEGLKLVTLSRPDLVLLDVSVTRRNGTGSECSSASARSIRPPR